MSALEEAREQAREAEAALRALLDATDPPEQSEPSDAHDCEFECASDAEHLRLAYDAMRKEYDEYRQWVRAAFTHVITEADATKIASRYVWHMTPSGGGLRNSAKAMQEALSEFIKMRSEAAHATLRAAGVASKQANKPAEDERERIEQSNDIAYTVIEVAQNKAPAEFVTLDFRYGIADALWAAGYRKGPRPITDEMVEAAARIDFEFGEESMTWWNWIHANPGHAAWCRSKARAALEAAEEARR